MKSYNDYIKRVKNETIPCYEPLIGNEEIKILKKREIETKLAIASLYKSQIKQLKNHYPNLMEFGGELATEVIWRLR